MYENLIKQKKLSVTKQRIALLEALDVAREPVTIEFLKPRVSTPMDTSTLYRSLKALVDVGLVYQTDFRDGVSYFEFHRDREHHHHIVCVHCKERKSITHCVSEYFPEISQETGFIITNHIFEIFGVCKNCS